MIDFNVLAAIGIAASEGTFFDRDYPSDDPTPTEESRMLAYPSDFGAGAEWGERLDNGWCVGPVTLTRDSGLLDKSNDIALRRELKRLSTLGILEEEIRWEIFGASHWAVGWVDHLSFRVREEENGPLTREARFVIGWFRHLREVYPLADEELHSEMEYEATLENIRWELRMAAGRDKIPDWILHLEGVEGDFFSWLFEHDQRAVESRDDSGGYPSAEALVNAWKSLRHKLRRRAVRVANGVAAFIGGAA